VKRKTFIIHIDIYITTLSTTTDFYAKLNDQMFLSEKSHKRTENIQGIALHKFSISQILRVGYKQVFFLKVLRDYLSKRYSEKREKKQALIQVTIMTG
jgi:hypothetical protein